MNVDDQERIAKVLRRINRREWEAFLASPPAGRLRAGIEAVVDATLPDRATELDRLGFKEQWERWLVDDTGAEMSAPLRRAVAAADAALGKARQLPGHHGVSVRVTTLLGYGLMQDRKVGPWVREQLLRGASRKTWRAMLAKYATLDSRKTVAVRSNASQRDSTPADIARYWHQGGRWARAFCEAFCLPDGVWQRHTAPQLDDEDVIPSEPLPPLHDYQQGAYEQLRALLAKRARGRTALLSLPTGAGKTRVVVEAVCDHLADKAGDSGVGAVLWIAHSAELQAQAWECFRAVWQVPPRRADGRPIRRVQPLRLVRLWGGRDPDTIGDESDGPEVLVASVDQLASWSRRAPHVIDQLRARRFACAVIDEAHGVITSEFRTVLEALGFKAEQRWLPAAMAPLLIGMTATPWRKAEDQDAALRRFFTNHLVTPAQLGAQPVASLQARGILSRVISERIDIVSAPAMTGRQRDHVERFHELPAEYLDRLAEDATRNRRIVGCVLSLGKDCKTLVFACSIEHAVTIAACIDHVEGPGTAVAVTSATPRAERALVIDQFRGSHGARVLCTVGVLAAGFDAPKVGAVVITRPTMSAALYEQMVGRGLRGPLNGGTKSCRVIDVQDDGLPDGVLSYERVIGRWSEGGAAAPSRKGRSR